MLNPSFTRQFEKDLSIATKRHKDLSKIKKAIDMLIREEPLSKKYRNHKLVGNYAGRMECHIEPDWLLVYKISKDEIVFERTGSHSDLFD